MCEERLGLELQSPAKGRDGASRIARSRGVCPVAHRLVERFCDRRILEEERPGRFTVVWGGTRVAQSGAWQERCGYQGSQHHRFDA